MNICYFLKINFCVEYCFCLTFLHMWIVLNKIHSLLFLFYWNWELPWVNIIFVMILSCKWCKFKACKQLTSSKTRNQADPIIFYLLRFCAILNPAFLVPKFCSSCSQIYFAHFLVLTGWEGDVISLQDVYWSGVRLLSSGTTQNDGYHQMFIWYFSGL